MTPNTIQFSSTDSTWVMRITADRRIEVNENVEVTEAAQKVLDAMQHLLNPAPVQATMKLESSGPGHGPAPNQKLSVRHVSLIDAGKTPPAAPVQPVQEPEIVQRVKRYAGQTMRTARNPNITARECIELANWIVATPPAAHDLQAELDATNRQVEILSDALAESRREVTALNAAQPAPVQEPHKGLSEHLAQATNGRVYVDPVTGDVGIGTPAAPVQEPVAWPMEEQPDGSIIPVDPSELPSDYFTTPPAAAVQEGRDWSLLEATQESLREHMAEIKRLKAAQPAVPDAIGPNEDELPAYAAGWNDCRQAMLEMMK